MDWLLNAWWRRPKPKPPAPPPLPAEFSLDASPWDGVPWRPDPGFALDLAAWDAIAWPD
jgi:hypothetical protein